MIQKLRLIRKKLQFYFKASNSKGHGTHSPFAYTFITEILNDIRYFYAYEEIGFLKKELLRDKRKVNYQGKETTIKKLADGLLPDKYSQLLFRVVDYFKPRSILEIGGSLGISTAYLAAANGNTPVVCAEESEVLSTLSKQTLRELSLENVSIIPYDKTFFANMNKGQRTFDLIFVNDVSEDLFDVYLALTNLFNKDSVLIFRDINKNLEKNKSWTRIKTQATITLSIELFGMGFIFFRKEQLKKEHFAVRF